MSSSKESEARIVYNVLQRAVCTRITYEEQTIQNGSPTTICQNIYIQLRTAHPIHLGS